jgi:two-component system CheB/CheR fusion protein
LKNNHKIIASLAGAALLLSVVVVSFMAFGQIQESAETRNHTYAVIIHANDLLSALKDAETGQRGYSLTDDESFLEPYFAVRDKINGQLKELRQLSSIGAADNKHLDAIAPLITAKMAEMSHVIDLCRKHDMPAVIAVVKSGQGKQLMDSIRAEMRGFIQIEEGALGQDEAVFQSNMNRMFIVIVAVSLLTLLFAFIFVYLMYRETQQQIKNLVHKETESLLKIQEATNKQLEQTNATLQVSEEKLAVTLNSIGDAVIATDAKGNVTLLNPLAEKLTGWTQKEAVGRPVEDIFHIINQETRKPSIVPIKETLAHGTIHGLANHTILISRAGIEFVIDDSCAPIRNRDGQVIGAVMVFRDVTEDREIEKGLEKTRKELETIKKSADESSEYSDSIINTVREPLISLDQDLRVVSASRSFYEVFKVKPEETVGQLIYDLGNKQWDIPKLRELLETILPQKASFDNYEVEHDFATIGRRVMLLNARQIQRVLGKERIILLAIEDITERREIENGLEKTRKELVVIKKTADEVSEYSESIINTVREPLISLDHNLRVVSVSRSFYEFFKVNPRETVGKLIYDLGNKQWDIPKLRELLETILPQKATFDNYEVEHDFATIGRRVMLLNARQIQRVLGKDRIILLAIEDITERREIEKGLEKTRKELVVIKKTADEASEYSDSIINTVREPLISLDQDLRVVSASRSFYEVFKVKPEETVGQLIYDLGNKQWNIPKLRELLETILPQKATFDNYEVEHDFATIGRRVMLLNARQIQRVLGKERIILLSIEDITSRREIESGLEKTRKELVVIKKTADEVSEFAESIINTVREPLISLDQNLRVVTVSRSFYDFFKVIPEDTIGQLIYDLGNKQWDIPKLRELLETILPQEATFDNYEVEHDFATIGRRVMLLNARQIQRASGKDRIILLAIEDITERREIENGLEKTRKELVVIKKTADEVSEYSESIINTVREPLISLDQDLRVVSASRSFYEVFKVNPKETVGKLIYDLGNKQWDIPKLRELLETILPQKATFDNYEVEHDFATIGRRVMLLNARQIQRVLGKERIILLSIEDITSRREIENGLEKAHEELQDLAVELKRTTQAKSIFLANMSHELRTPLNSINGFSEVLYDETFGTLNEKQKKYVNNVLTSGKHLLLLINQILDMAKVESGKMKTALSILPLKSMLNEISLLIEDMVSKKKLHMVLEIADDLPNIEADELKVKEIIYNLLSNAVKFTPEGGKIGMRAKKINSNIEVEVWDTGDGIAPENMEKIFEGFFRVDTPYSRVTEGSGLGLPLSKKLVELHGGKLSVESEGLTKGTLVRFTLPIISREAVAL